jgi:regulation of enolase protein 1 (concanavalin A-like superfamily)
MSFNLSLSKEEILSTNKLSWYCEPKEWQVNNGLVIQSEPKTDYWSKTHYGFIADNGHLLYKPVEGNFIMTTKVLKSCQFEIIFV